MKRSVHFWGPPLVRYENYVQTTILCVNSDAAQNYSKRQLKTFAIHPVKPLLISTEHTYSYLHKYI